MCNRKQITNNKPGTCLASFGGNKMFSIYIEKLITKNARKPFVFWFRKFNSHTIEFGVKEVADRKKEGKRYRRHEIAEARSGATYMYICVHLYINK